MNDRIVGSRPTGLRRVGYTQCARCGIDIKVSSTSTRTLHLCVPCRSDRYYVQAVTRSEQCQDSM